MVSFGSFKGLEVTQPKRLRNLSELLSIPLIFEHAVVICPWSTLKEEENPEGVKMEGAFY